ncbi:molybdate ABC transporter substrate-binding protein [Rhodoferax sp.]|uniref:molybdate ABC transporter substrate-binding protein n=1 Tax=Rhodoferax sp. TaxID=50421 RepID=UPI002840BEF6|nr:molybdate ABC transporter substrate-binding protein [Rhodoferax sp.]MDR3370649.1 molybdate ABC transporter substrate-binding protein [Rhodoferax sp.]
MTQMNKLLLGSLAVGLAGCASMERSGPVAVVSPTAVSVYAAGSLRAALTTIANDYEARTGQKIVLTFGASGLLRERIERGEAAQVFASADTDHPQRLASQGGWQPSIVFTRNTLCALTSDKMDATPATLLATLLRPEVRLGTSTPKSDPSGDYTWTMFEKADALHAGAFATLSAKAQKLVGAVNLPQPPEGRLAYAWIMDKGDVDVFLTYCTSAVAAQKEVPRLKVVQLPPELKVGAAYGMTVRQDAPPAASAFAKALLAPEGQAVFARFGFGAP